jgi:hypothetical protein
VADKEDADKRAAEEVVIKEAAVGIAGGSSASRQVPSIAVGARRAAMPSGSTPLAKRPNRRGGGLKTSVCPNFLYSAFFTS